MKNRNLLVCLVVCLAFAAVAAHANISRTLRYLGTPAMCWRSGDAMNQSNAVICLVDVSDNGFEPPSTNAANNYCGNGDAPSINPASPPAIGYDGTIWHLSSQTNGQVLGIIESGGLVDKNGLFRSFSAYAVTQAAYYADGASVTLQGVPGSPVTKSGTWTNNTVNPAYSMLAIDGYLIVLAGPGGSSVSGSVNSVAGGANNQFDNTVVAVYWRSNVPMTWQPLQNFSIFANGDFTGGCPNDTTEFMVGLTNGPSALPNSLLGQGPVPVPEPAALVVLLSAACLAWRGRTWRIDVQDIQDEVGKARRA